MVAERTKAESEDREEELEAERIMEEFMDQEKQVASKIFKGRNSTLVFQLRLAVERISEQITKAEEEMDKKNIDILT